MRSPALAPGRLVVVILTGCARRPRRRWRVLGPAGCSGAAGRRARSQFGDRPGDRPRAFVPGAGRPVRPRRRRRRPASCRFDQGVSPAGDGVDISSESLAVETRNPLGFEAVTIGFSAVTVKGMTSPGLTVPVPLAWALVTLIVGSATVRVGASAVFDFSAPGLVLEGGVCRCWSGSIRASWRARWARLVDDRGFEFEDDRGHRPSPPRCCKWPGISAPGCRLLRRPSDPARSGVDRRR